MLKDACISNFCHYLYSSTVASTEQSFTILLKQPLCSVLTRLQVGISFHILQHMTSANNKAALPVITSKAA